MKKHRKKRLIRSRKRNSTKNSDSRERQQEDWDQTQEVLAVDSGGEDGCEVVMLINKNDDIIVDIANQGVPENIVK